VLNLEIEEVNEQISLELMSDLINLSKQKFSSNVIEKCLDHNTPQMNARIVQSLMGAKDQFFNMLIDNFGNYVVQKCLQVAQQP
jgi:pumilio RNA-binding family|tara:strand:+ start:273 stop:524 length:252 start_codon:yes stop_codon:yes gene_type:complete